MSTPLISEFMKILRDDYGFDTLAVRRLLIHSIPASGRRDLRILDVGAGSGWMAITAAQHGYDVVSIDPDQEGLLHAQDRAGQALGRDAGRIRFLCADASRMPFRGDLFDAVLSFDVVHHFADYLCPAAIAEMVRVCKPGARLVIGDLSERGIRVVHSIHARAGLTHDQNRCGVREIDALLRRAGLDVVREDTPFVSVFHAEKLLLRTGEN